MKTAYTYTLIVLLATLVTSCEKLLEIDAKGTVSGDIYTNTENIQKALLGAYYSLGGISDGADGGELLGGDFAIMSDLLAHENGIEIFWSSTLAPNYANFIDKDVLATNQRVAVNWRRGYEVINACNNILANIENVDDATERNRIQGEALAIRGILYFEMVRLWAPQYDADGINPATDLAIPIITEPIVEVDEIQPAVLETIEEVYTQAENDLEEASTLLLPFGTNGTNISYYACEAYLARLAMQKSDFSSAAEHAGNVIDGGAYSLSASPLDAFHNTDNSSEDIFAIQQTLANSSGDRTTGTGIVTHYSSLTESGYGSLAILSSTFNTSFLFNSPRFSSNDLRGTIYFTVSSGTGSDDINTGYYQHILNNNPNLLSISKYMRADRVFPIIRLAEMHLIRAEALNELIGVNSVSISDLNLIRTRAGINAVQASDFVDFVQFYDSLTIERSREFMYEGMLLHDLKRWRAFGARIGSTLNPDDPWDDKFVLPIPQNELDASGLSTD